MRWAVDPFDENTEARLHVVETLRGLSEQGAIIYPVYILSPDEYEMGLDFNRPWLEQIRPTAQKMLDHALSEIKFNGFLEPKVAISKKPSISCSVKALLSYAKRIQADSIVVGTHARKGIERFFLGSFSETLLLFLIHDYDFTE